MIKGPDTPPLENLNLYYQKYALESPPGKNSGSAHVSIISDLKKNVRYCYPTETDVYYLVTLPS